MNQFVKKMLQLGAQYEQAATGEECQEVANKAIKLYNAHILKFQEGNLTEMVRDLKAFDIESLQVCEIVYINFQDNAMTYRTPQGNIELQELHKVKFINS